jgi:predicted NAD/FAD-dependent oxidoreductase
VNVDVAVVGGGVAGLSCAQELTRAGASVVVLECTRYLGGRCATWVHDGQPIDHGTPFLHGNDLEFVAALTVAAGPSAVAGWPRMVAAEGAVATPSGLGRGETRLAFEGGIVEFPKALSRGIDVRLSARVASFSSDGRDILVFTDSGETIGAHDLVLAMPPQESLPLMEASSTSSRRFPHWASITRLLSMLASVPCITVLASYPATVPDPPFDLLLPPDSPVLQAISHDSAKRMEPRFRALVYQARPCWSRLHLDAEEGALAGEILHEAVRYVGPWAVSPLWFQSHRWHHARADGGSELSGPIVLKAERAARIGFAGDAFAPGGGVQAAWISGRALARRLMGKESSGTEDAIAG